MSDSFRKGRGAQKRLHNPFRQQEVIPDADHLTDQEEAESVLFPKPETRVLEVTAASIVNRVESPDVPMGWSLNPYQGCEHGCVYCYARNSHTYWDGGAGIEFETRIQVKVNAVELLRRFFLKSGWAGDPIVMAGNTDIYQPVERKRELTRRLLSTFLEFRHPVGLITKNSLIDRDTDLLSDLARDQLVHVNLSLTTLDESVKRKLEPRTSSAASVLKTIRRLTDAGIPVNVLMAPIIPGLTDHEILRVFEAASDAGALSAGGLVVRLNGQVGDLMTDWIGKAFPHQAEKVLNRIKSLHGGQLNDSRFGRRMTGEGPWAATIRSQVHLARERFFSDRQMPEFNRSLFAETRPGQMDLF
ncbi:MAG: PA0069 family radical SAM protein [Bacteroidetes bacterium]|nr:PA0069 family radical SAM protein [Bacteroidota bacterium]